MHMLKTYTISLAAHVVHLFSITGIPRVPFVGLQPSNAWPCTEPTSSSSQPLPWSTFDAEIYVLKQRYYLKNNCVYKNTSSKRINC